jgi:hypothetical protein
VVRPPRLPALPTLLEHRALLGLLHGAAPQEDVPQRVFAQVGGISVSGDPLERTEDLIDGSADGDVSIPVTLVVLMSQHERPQVRIDDPDAAIRTRRAQRLRDRADQARDGPRVADGAEGERQRPDRGVPVSAVELGDQLGHGRLTDRREFPDRLRPLLVAAEYAIVSEEVDQLADPLRPVVGRRRGGLRRGAGQG